MMSTTARWALILIFSCVLAACSDEGNESAKAAPKDSTAFNEKTARAFFNAHNCNACHEVDEQRIGPAYRDVAIRYEDSSTDRVDWLAQKIIHGGAGSWGFVPMVTNPDISPEEARAISRWILALDDESAG